MKVAESKDPQVKEGLAEGKKAGSSGNISGEQVSSEQGLGDDRSSGDEWGSGFGEE